MNKDLTDKLRKCAEYMDWELMPNTKCFYDNDHNKYEIKNSYADFAWLMPLWSKLRGELDSLSFDNSFASRKRKIVDRWQICCDEHANDPSKAFEVVCEAVDLVTNQKGKQ